MQNNKPTVPQTTSITLLKQKTLDLSSLILENPSEISLVEMELTISANLDKPIIRSVFKGNKARVAYSVVRVLVSRFLESFTFTQKLSSAQIDSLTVDTLEHFGYESLEDIILFFKMARTGKFGVAKKGIDANMIFGEWFPQYLELKTIEREKQVQNERFSWQKEQNKNAVRQVYSKIQAEQKAKEKAKRIQERIDELTAPFDRQMLEDTIRTWQKSENLKEYVPLLKRKRMTIRK